MRTSTCVFFDMLYASYRSIPNLKLDKYHITYPWNSSLRHRGFLSAKPRLDTTKVKVLYRNNTPTKPSRPHNRQSTNPRNPISTPSTVANLIWSKLPLPSGPKAQEEMVSQPPHPALTPQFCFSTTALREFLRVSRFSIDDSITQNLNALATPAARGFDVTSTSHRNLSGAHTLDPHACSDFKSQILFPGWKARSDVLQYCGNVAVAPDPDDPGLVARQLEEERGKARVIDDRLDPYSSRFFPKESRTEELARVVRMEGGVERIIRARTWEVVEEKCGEGRGRGWEDALREWESGKQRGASDTV
ncbi:hypothetical protein V493_03495 [Pseudogymnoascus sp. VKM F-4281 (FW-2241)]|nr:hypothetical protein V493_03495 [Pseudogymnoascus sp. VKM F-4281 (FW-2241)]